MSVIVATAGLEPNYDSFVPYYVTNKHKKSHKTKYIKNKRALIKTHCACCLVLVIGF